MNYSRRKSDRIFNGLFGGVLKAAFVLAAAAWFCSGINIPAEKSGTAAAEPATVEIPETAVAEVSAFEEDFDAAADAVSEDGGNDSEGFINPTVGVLTSSFGERWGRRHNGIDIGSDSGTEILAAAGGTVTFSGNMSGYGNYIVIDHGNGYETAYGHCSSLVAREGEVVKQGALIAYVGSTGNSTGPHLHFEVKANGEFKNPLNYVIY